MYGISGLPLRSARPDEGSEGEQGSQEDPKDRLFISSTISRDDTQGKTLKEEGMLAQLKDQLSTGGLQLGSTQPLLTVPTTLPPPRRWAAESPPPSPPRFMPPPPPPSGAGPAFGRWGPWPWRNHNNQTMPWRDEVRRLRGEPAHHSAEEETARTTDDRDLNPPKRDNGKGVEGAKVSELGDGEQTYSAKDTNDDAPSHDDPEHMSTALSYVANRYVGIDVLDQASELPRFVGYLLDTINFLENQVKYYASGAAKDGDDGSDGSSVKFEDDGSEKQDQKSRAQVLHRVFCTSAIHVHDGSVFEDEPKFKANQLHGGVHGDLALQGQCPVNNLSLYLAQHTDIVFLVFKQHVCVVDERTVIKRRRQDDLGPNAEVRDKIRIVSPVLQKALEKTAMFPLYGESIHPTMAREMEAPYDFLFHHRRKLETLAEESDTYGEVLRPLLDYIGEDREAEYHEAEEMFGRGMVTMRHLSKLFKPNHLVLSRVTNQNRFLEAHVLTQYPQRDVANEKITLRGWSWQYDGVELQRRIWEDLFDFISDDETAIMDLPVHPLEYARDADIERLRARGRKFWSLNGLLEYSGWNKSRDDYYANARFYVDFATYWKMHPTLYRNAYFDANKFDEWPVVVEGGADLTDECLMLLPPVAYGFNLHQKKWVTLDVENFRPVKWNKKAFERLVLDPKTKELIYALINVQASMDKTMDDIITGKGNGLIILLHGSPGTGKTLTAESVAEIAEKPLYRVTCGDIGTDAEEVEKYLQTVMYLGKTWDCVLLLDEADVFLEERTMADMQRNSLVSVFLRILEYYEGILILTSNRVGTFDEAFKSRIQVAIHYSDLTKRMRKAIWRNFFDMLEEEEDQDGPSDINMPELERRLDELAAEEMNGRQIRNALLTARQLAKHRQERLDWEHLSQVIRTSATFNKYLKQVRGHSDSEWAREENIR